MLITFIISTIAFVLLTGLYITMHGKLYGHAGEESSVPHKSFSLLLTLGHIVSLVFCIVSLASLISNLFSTRFSYILGMLMTVSIGVLLATFLYWLAHQLFTKGTIPTNKLLLRQQNEQSNLALSIDTNLALDYLNNESEEERDSAELLENALNLWSIEISECFIPRNEIVSVDIKDDISTIKNTFIESKHSKLIVCENDTDNILGYIHHSDFYDDPTSIKDLIREIPTVPESMTAIEMLSFFKKKQKSIAWVVDEFGGTAGILTTEDLLEELFGEIEDEHDESEYIEQQISADEFILSGRLEVEYINDKFNLEIPTAAAETLSGYIIEVHNEIPEKDEIITIDHYEYKILQVSKTRIETIRLKVIEE